VICSPSAATTVLITSSPGSRRRCSKQLAEEPLEAGIRLDQGAEVPDALDPSSAVPIVAPSGEVVRVRRRHAQQVN